MWLRLRREDGTSQSDFSRATLHAKDTFLHAQVPMTIVSGLRGLNRGLNDDSKQDRLTRAPGPFVRVESQDDGPKRVLRSQVCARVLDSCINPQTPASAVRLRPITIFTIRPDIPEVRQPMPDLQEW
jgi:hypothetical protein